MNNVVHFKPQSELSTVKNLANFIGMAKDQIKLWSSYDGFDWDSNVWPTHLNKIRFYNIKGKDVHHTKKLSEELTLSSPFIEFAKAYIRYKQSIKQTKVYNRTITALVLIENALITIDEAADITKATQRHFDKACELLVNNNYKDRTGIGGALETIAKDLGKWHISAAGLKYWKHPFTKADAHDVRKKSTDRLTKLPEDDALLALAEIFANGYISEQDDEDIYVTCQTCLLLSAPQRIHESRWFRTDLLREEQDTLGNSQLYISYWAAKNASYVRKEVPKTMATHTKEAVERIKKITEESRKLAKYYESGSTKFYRHKNCPDVRDDQVLTRKEVAQALGLENHKSAEDFIRKETGSYSLTGWTLDSLWNQIVLPKHKRNLPHFPYQLSPEDCASGRPPKMSKSLMCFRHRQLASTENTSPVLLAAFNRDYYTKRVEDKEVIRGDKKYSMSIFIKHGYKGFNLRSHQMRHFLNTMAQEAGIGLEEITQWSTRASQAQSRTYMHQEPQRKANEIAHKQLQMNENTLEPVTEDEYNVMEKGPVITTMYGVCTHDYTFTPCEKHADCLNCSELLICKGHKRTTEAIQREYAQLTENLLAAKSEIDAGRQVANRWYISHKKKHERLTQLLKILADPSIEDGSPIQLIGEDFSHHKRIVDKKIHENILIDETPTGLKYSDEVLECLALLRKEDNV